MEKSYEYWRIACQRDNRFIILFFYFQNVHTPAAPLDLQGHRIDASLCPDHIAESYEYCPHHYLRIRSDLPDFIYYGVCGRLPGSQIVDRWYSRFVGSCFGQCNFLCTGNSVSGYFGGTYGQFCHSQSGSGHIHTHLLPPIIIFVFLLLTRFFSHFHFFIEIASKSMSFPLAMNHGYTDV